MPTEWDPLRLLRTIGHMPAKQLRQQIRMRVKRRIGSHQTLFSMDRETRVNTRFPSHSLVRTMRWHHKLGHGEHEWARNFADGNVALLRRNLHRPPADYPWDWSGFGRLWQFELHYLDALPLLVSTEDEQDLKLAAQLLDNWRASNPPGRDPGWGPYPLSRRILNFSRCLAMMAQQSRLRQTLSAELALSFHALWHQRETHIRANHLLTNLHALLSATHFLGETVATPNHTKELYQQLISEWDEQFLEDGGHFERSPGYHASLFRELRELSLLLNDSEETAGAVIKGPLKKVLSRAEPFLQQVCHPDGRPAFFHDSNLTLPRFRFETDLQAGPPGVHNSPDSGYVTYREGPWYGILFNGTPGPHYQPGHCHCDALSIEVSYNGQRLLTNAGVAGYAEAPDRKWMREAVAHNTVEIPGRQQHEVWSSFRVGYRGIPGTTSGEENFEMAQISAEFQYHGQPRLTHKRAVKFMKTTGGLEIRDSLMGTTTSPPVSRLHLHPDFLFDPDKLLITGPNTSFSVAPFQASVTLQHGTWMPEFGERIPLHTIQISPHNPLLFGLDIAPL